MANAIVQEVLDFVRPIRLQVERTGDRRGGAAARCSWPTPRRAAATIDVDVAAAGGLPQIQGDQHQLTQLFTNLLINAYEAMGGTRPGRHHGRARRAWTTAATGATRCWSK